MTAARTNAIRFRWVVRPKSLTPSICAFISGDSKAGGGGSRTSLPLVNAHGFHDPASGNDGVGLLQRPGVAGNDPEKTISEPSRFAQATTSSPIMPPRRVPAVTSDGNSVPAYRRENPTLEAVASMSGLSVRK